VHFDADVLDDELMPAVDYRQKDGLQLTEAQQALYMALSLPQVRGMSVSIYNPKLDVDGSAGVALKKVLAGPLAKFA
jgi:arginase